MFTLFLIPLALNFFITTLYGSGYVQDQVFKNATGIDRKEVGSNSADGVTPKNEKNSNKIERPAASSSAAPKSKAFMLPEAEVNFRDHFSAQGWSLSSAYQAFRNLLLHPLNDNIFSNQSGPTNTLSKKFFLLRNQLSSYFSTQFSCFCDYHINSLHLIHAKYRKNPEFWIFYGIILSETWASETKKKLSLYLSPQTKIQISIDEAKGCLMVILGAKKFLQSKIDNLEKEKEHYFTFKYIFEKVIILLEEHFEELETKFADSLGIDGIIIQ